MRRLTLTISVGALLMAAVLGLGCGTKAPDEIAVTLDEAGNTFFGDPTLEDLIFLIDYDDENGAPQTSVFPAECAGGMGTGCSLSPRCGFSPTSSQFRLSLSDVPEGNALTLSVCGRQTDGTPIFSGTSASFTNSDTQISVSITLMVGG